MDDSCRYPQQLILDTFQIALLVHLSHLLREEDNLQFRVYGSWALQAQLPLQFHTLRPSDIDVLFVCASTEAVCGFAGAVFAAAVRLVKSWLPGVVFRSDFYLSAPPGKTFGAVHYTVNSRTVLDVSGETHASSDAFLKAAGPAVLVKYVVPQLSAMFEVPVSPMTELELRMRHVVHREDLPDGCSFSSAASSHRLGIEASRLAQIDALRRAGLLGDSATGHCCYAPGSAPRAFFDETPPVIDEPVNAMTTIAVTVTAFAASLDVFQGRVTSKLDSLSGRLDAAERRMQSRDQTVKDVLAKGVAAMMEDMHVFEVHVASVTGQVQQDVVVRRREAKYRQRDKIKAMFAVTSDWMKRRFSRVKTKLKKLDAKVKAMESHRDAAQLLVLKFLTRSHLLKASRAALLGMRSLMVSMAVNHSKARKQFAARVSMASMSLLHSLKLCAPHLSPTTDDYQEQPADIAGFAVHYAALAQKLTDYCVPPFHALRHVFPEGSGVRDLDTARSGSNLVAFLKQVVVGFAASTICTVEAIRNRGAVAPIPRAPRVARTTPDGKVLDDLSLVLALAEQVRAMGPIPNHYCVVRDDALHETYGLVLSPRSPDKSAAVEVTASASRQSPGEVPSNGFDYKFSVDARSPGAKISSWDEASVDTLLLHAGTIVHFMTEPLMIQLHQVRKSVVKVMHDMEAAVSAECASAKDAARHVMDDAICSSLRLCNDIEDELCIV